MVVEREVVGDRQGERSWSCRCFWGESTRRVELALICWRVRFNERELILTTIRPGDVFVQRKSAHASKRTMVCKPWQQLS